MQEKQSEIKRASSKTHFPSFGHENTGRSEHMNIQKNFDDSNHHNSIFDENRLRQVKSYDKLPSEMKFFKNRQKNNVFSPQRTRNNFMKTSRMDRFINTEMGNTETKEVKIIVNHYVLSIL